MDRRAFLLFGAAGVSAGVSSWYPPIEASSDVVGRTREASGLLSLPDLGDRDPPYFDSDRATVTGSGDDSFEYSSAGGFTMVRGRHEAGSAFSVTAGGREFTADDSGQIMAGYPMTATTHTISVTAESDWQLTLARPQAPAGEIREPPARAVGNGDVIVGPLDTTEQTLVQATHEGDGPFEVSLALESSPGVFDPETLFETTGSLDGEVVTRMAGTAWVVVVARGSWTLNFRSAV